MMVTSNPIDTENTRPLARLRILHVEDSDNDAFIIAKMLEKEAEHFRSVRVQNREEMESALDSEIFDVILCDHDMPDFSALGALELLGSREIDVPFIIVTGAIGGEEAAVELMRKGATDFVPKHKLSRLPLAIRREIREAHVRQAKKDTEEALRRKNGELEASIAALKRTQEELVKVDRLTRLEKMTEGITHDLNNAFERIFGIVDLLEREKLDLISANLQKLRDTTVYATQTVKRLNYFCDVHPREGEGEPVDLGIAIRESLDISKHRWESADCRSESRIEVEINLRPMPEVIGDADHFRDAFVTLISNACDSMPLGGHLKISSYRNTRAVVVEIEDTGVGMSQAELDDCYADVSSCDGDNLPGGVSMAWVVALMARYGGVMRIKSEEDRGTKVQLRFAISDRNHHGTEVDSDENAPTASLRIVVVDDEKFIADCLASYLEEDNHVVKSTSSGYEVLDFLRDEVFDVVISDRAMRELSGEELARKVKERGGREKFIMATGSGDLMIANCEVVEGVDVILPKPITRQALRRALRDAGAYLPS